MSAFRVFVMGSLVISLVGVARSEPLGLTGRLKDVGTVQKYSAPVVDRTAIATEDAQRELQDKPPRYAIPNATHITPDTHGTWEQPDRSTLVWRLRVNSPGANSINFGFTRYVMPPGGKLTVYSVAGTHVIRSFTELDNETHGELWTPPVRSDDVMIEVEIPAALRPQLQLVLGSVNVGYREFGKEDPPQVVLSGSCNVDVICPQGDPWRDQIKSVGVISTGGSTFCTGFMVNNTAQDLKPYFMTANHCSITSGNAASLVVFWNYENSTCRPVGSAQSGGAGDGQLNEFQTGSIFRAAVSNSDFTLVELDDDPNPEWEVVFAGWDHSGAESPNGACIHHPATDEKRITFYSTPTTTTSYNNPAVPGDGTHVHATWSLGVTEPGSSGSPLFDSNHRIIGQLHGGPSACGGSDLSDYYGRFSRSWTGGGTSSTRLSNWLDPLNTGAAAIDHLSSGGLSVTPGENVLHVGQVGGPFTNPSVVYTLTNPTNQPLDYSVSLTTSFGILLNAGTSPVTGTLNGSSSVQVTVSLGAAINSLGAGVYVESVVFEDLTNGLTATRQHTVEIGQTLISVTPSSDLESGGPVGGPFPGSIVYTVTSQRPTPVTVQVSASHSWISLNGVAGPLSLNLSGTGDSQTVTVAFSAAADALPPAIYDGTVSFSNLSGGAGNTSRAVSLDVGRVVYPSTDTPKPIPDNGATTSLINVTEDFCIGDVDVDMNITHTYIGDLIINLTSPGGTVVRLHNRSGGTTEDIVATYDDDGGGRLPDGPGALSDFDFERSIGVWTLSVSDNAGSDVGTLNSWALRIAPVSGSCPTPVRIYSFPLDANPGWSVQGQWAFGDPTGAGSNNHDPNTGFTGANVYGYNLSGDYPSNMSATQYLTTTALDCSSVTRTKLRFQRWLGVESAQYDHANVQVSANGTTWTTVFEHTGGSVSDASWNAQAIDISTVADHQGTVYVRWGMGPTDGSVTYPGWNLDDIEIWGVVVTGADCNNNQVPDDVDISGGFSQDCNANNIPDECDITDCAGAAACADCNNNGVPDGCDIAGGASEDCNNNGSPDECDPSLPIVGFPLSECRFISFTVDGLPVAAIQVKLVSLHHVAPPYSGGPSVPFTSFEGQVRWVGPPQQYIESTSVPVPFMASALQCTPHYQDWSTVGTLHVTGSGIAPSSAYEVRVFDGSCQGIESTCGNVSCPLALETTRWGDVEQPYNPPSTTTQPDLGDVSAMVNKFKSTPGAPIKARTLLVGDDAFGNISPATMSLDLGFSHIAACVDAFKGKPYPHTIQSCP